MEDGPYKGRERERFNKKNAKLWAKLVGGGSEMPNP